MSHDQNQQNKRQVWDFWQSLEAAPDRDVQTAVERNLHPDHVWHGPDPINNLQGREAFAKRYWLPLLHSFPDMQRQTHVFFGGKSSGRVDGLRDGRMWVCGTGYFNATFTRDYLTIPANKQKVSIRWGEFCRLEDGVFVETYFLIDQIDLMQQAGFEVLPPSRGIDGLYPPPSADDGILLGPQDADISAHTLQHIRDFIFDGLNNYDQADLQSMGMADYFDPKVHWYGPGGIGACLSFKDFENNHQKHWLRAYPDRQVQDLDALIAEGSYSGGPGWAGVLATHTGQYLDCQATGRPIEFNGIDVWKLENDRYIENWVFVDMVHLFRQFGVDLFERLAEQVADA